MILRDKYVELKGRQKDRVNLNLRAQRDRKRRDVHAKSNIFVCNMITITYYWNNWQEMVSSFNF